VSWTHYKGLPPPRQRLSGPHPGLKHSPNTAARVFVYVRVRARALPYLEVRAQDHDARRKVDCHRELRREAHNNRHLSNGSSCASVPPGAHTHILVSQGPSVYVPPRHACGAARAHLVGEHEGVDGGHGEGLADGRLLRQ
jgi:hypothetical protein